MFPCARGRLSEEGEIGGRPAAGCPQVSARKSRHSHSENPHSSLRRHGSACTCSSSSSSSSNAIAIAISVLPTASLSIGMGMAAVLLLSFLLLAAPAAAIDILRRSLAAQTKGDLASITAGNPLVANAMNDRLKNLTDAFAQQMGKEFHYCIKDTDDEWNIAFNFSTDPTFLSNCMQATDGDVPQRVCTAAEMKFYFESFLDSNGRKNYVRPNKNCNLTSWMDGCEAGWACSAGPDQNINLQDAVNFPSRTLDCRGCCAGFFCPHGLTCMIPCPLGAYCPESTLNKTTGICDPYNYQPPPGKPNHTCGGADRWADVVSTDDVFCPAGFYCPSTIKKLSCSISIAGRDQLPKPNASTRAAVNQTL